MKTTKELRLQPKKERITQWCKEVPLNPPRPPEETLNHDTEMIDMAYNKLNTSRRCQYCLRNDIVESDDSKCQCEEYQTIKYVLVISKNLPSCAIQVVTETNDKAQVSAEYRRDKI